MAYSSNSSEKLKSQSEQVAKQVPMQKIFDDFILPEMGSYYDNFPVNFDASPRACCPLHSEDTPSFRYYRETNTYHCFGCNKTGNVIKLFQEYNNINKGTNIGYYAAASILYKKYIQGKDTSGLLHTEHKLKMQPVKPKEENSKVDIIRLQSYIDKIEKIVATSDIDLKIKKKIWEQLDIIDTVLEQSDDISAIDTHNYIKKFIENIDKQEGTNLSKL